MKNTQRGEGQGARGKGQGVRGQAAFGLVLGLLAAAPLFAQGASTTPFDSRWTPYLGCWQIAQEYVDAQTVPVAPGLMVCVQPSGRSAVTITTTVEGKNVLEQRVVADGTAQPVSQADCQGTQTSEWSRDGERLFTRVELACNGRPTRVVSGITQLARGYWIDAQATVFDGDHDVRLRRYRRTSDPAVGSVAPGGDATGLMSIEDVIEASAKVVAPALEAALVEAGGRVELDSRALKQLADAGVSPNVIDVMVAQAYPDRFQVERPPAYPPAQPAPLSAGGSTWSGGTSVSVFAGTAGYPYPAYDPFYSSYYYYSPFAYPYYWGAGYYPYRYGYGYGYGLGYGGSYNNYYYGGLPGTAYGSGYQGSGRPAQPGSPDSPGGDGRVINGRGYTRVRPSSGSGGGGDNAAPAPRTTGGGRAVRSGSDSSSGSSSSSSSSSGSSSSGSSGGSTSGGRSSSGGGSSGGGGRTAQPR